MKNKTVVNKIVYQVVAFNGAVNQYFGDSYKDAEEVFFKSHVATQMYRIVDGIKTLLKENTRRMKHPGQMQLALQGC